MPKYKNKAVQDTTDADHEPSHAPTGHAAYQTLLRQVGRKENEGNMRNREPLTLLLLV